jgi:hypothetical protein
MIFETQLFAPYLSIPKESIVSIATESPSQAGTTTACCHRRSLPIVEHVLQLRTEGKALSLNREAC